MQQIYLIGTTHQETVHYSAADLASILRKIDPEVILQELTTDFYTDDWTRKQCYEGQEDKALSDFLSTSPMTVQRPYDIEGRNDYYRSTLFFEKERDLWQALQQLHDDGRLPDPQNRGYGSMMMLIDMFRSMAKDEHPRVIDSLTMDLLVESLHRLISETLEHLCRTCAELRAHLDAFLERERYEERRNEEMALNIRNRLADFGAHSRFAVMCGFEHRFALRKLLQPHSDTGGFELVEYWHGVPAH